MMHRRFLILSILFLFVASAYGQQTDTLRELNRDLWVPTRTYIYQAVLTDSLGGVISDEVVTLVPTGKVWEADAKQTLANFTVNFRTEDSSRLANLMATEYSGRASTLVRAFQEGVMQNKDRVWIHPLRRNQYELTEVSPFPEVLLPLYVGRSWSSRLSIMEGWGRFQGAVAKHYSVKGVATREVPFGSLLCYKIEATGTHDSLGDSHLELFFNPEYGFSEMYYTFFNGHRLSIVLTDVRFR